VLSEATMTLPSLPDNLYKLFILAGIFCLAYGYIEDSNSNDKYWSKVDIFNGRIDSINIEITKFAHQREKLSKVANLLSKRNNVPNPIEINDSIIVFTQAVKGDKKEVSVSDSLSKLWKEYKEAEFNITLFNKQLDKKKQELKQAKDEYNAAKETNIWVNITGGMCLIFGLIGMMWFQAIQDELLKRQLSDKPKIYRYCQSCGKKFSSVRPNSKNSDGSVNSAFCSSCFSDGQFMEAELTKDEFQKRAIKEVQKRKTWFGRKLLSTRLKNLERWDSDEYF
jgi:hypothetical protein